MGLKFSIDVYRIRTGEGANQIAEYKLETWLLAKGVADDLEPPMRCRWSCEHLRGQLERSGSANVTE